MSGPPRTRPLRAAITVGAALWGCALGACDAVVGPGPSSDPVSLFEETWAAYDGHYASFRAPRHRLGRGPRRLRRQRHGLDPARLPRPDPRRDGRGPRRPPRLPPPAVRGLRNGSQAKWTPPRRRRDGSARGLARAVAGLPAAVRPGGRRGLPLRPEIVDGRRLNGARTPMLPWARSAASAPSSSTSAATAAEAARPLRPSPGGSRAPSACTPSPACAAAHATATSAPPSRPRVRPGGGLGCFRWYPSPSSPTGTRRVRPRTSCS